MNDSDKAEVEAALMVLDQAGARAENRCPRSDDATMVPNFQRAAREAPLEVRSRLDRVIMGPNPEAGLDALLQDGALAALLPEVKALVGFGDGEWRHKDVWKHTKQVVSQASPRLEVRWAALLHDIGKVRTRSVSADGQIHFFGHAELGARMFDRLENRLRIFSHEPSLRRSVRFLIFHHLRANQYEPSWTDSAVRRFARDIGAELDNLLCLSRADITTKRPEKKSRGLRQIDELEARIRELAILDSRVPPLPTGVGNDIMQAFSLSPSVLIGNIKKALEKAVEDGEIPGHEPSEFYVQFLRDNRLRFGLPEPSEF